MRGNYWRVGVTLLALVAFAAASLPSVYAKGGRRQLGTITGTVRDTRGNPLAGALVQLLREGADEVIKQTRTAADGSFTTRIGAGKYLLSAVADGFSKYTFSAVQVAASSEIIYRFNLEPVGRGRTVPERRPDASDPKWRLRSAQGRRSIFQAGEEPDATVAAVERALEEAEQMTRAGEEDGEEPSAGEAAQETSERRRLPVRGVVETYAGASANPAAPFLVGTNFALSAPVNERLELVFAGQFATNQLARLETTGRLRAGRRHKVSATLGGASLPVAARAFAGKADALKQLSVRATDEWIVRDGVVVVLGLDYSRFLGPDGDSVFSPRLGFQYEVDARTRLNFAYAPNTNSTRTQSSAQFEDGAVVFPDVGEQAVAFVDGRAVMERSRRLEFGVERVIDNDSSVEAAAFFDTTDGRGVGLLSMPLDAFANAGGAELLSVANQQGAARGLRVVYARRLNSFLKTSAGYSFGRGQELAPGALAAGNPAQVFRGGFFQTAAAQLDSNFNTGTRVRTTLRFSPRAAVFAIDPFAGRLAVFDPSLSILVTQDLPTFGLPVRAEAVLDARNLLDAQPSVDDGETLTTLNNTRRTLRGGISVRF